MAKSKYTYARKCHHCNIWYYLKDYPDINRCIQRGCHRRLRSRGRQHDVRNKRNKEARRY